MAGDHVFHAGGLESFGKGFDLRGRRLKEVETAKDGVEFFAGEGGGCLQDDGVRTGMAAAIDITIPTDLSPGSRTSGI